MTRQLPELEARDLLARYDVSALPVPVEDMARRMGTKIARAANATDSTVGFLLRDGERTVLGLDSRLSGRRQRWIIAHLLGHWLLGADRQLTVDHGLPLAAGPAPAAAPLDEEAAANAFAAALLLPGELVDAAVRRGLAAAASRDVLVRRLAAEFDVSNEVVTWRLLGLGVLT